MVVEKDLLGLLMVSSLLLIVGGLGNADTLFMSCLVACSVEVVLSWGFQMSIYFFRLCFTTSDGCNRITSKYCSAL